ncbi:MAG: carbamoyl-phosphate synthase large subunit [Gammaproteobacteria bacterium]
MPRNKNINSVLVLGAGPIVIGQACEFDYSGTQACRVLREEGIRVVLLNSNPATIMTDPDMADATYIEPVDADTAQAIIAKEKVDAVLPTMGGQTALNCAMELHRRGVFAEGKPVLIGAGAESIRAAEDRHEFKRAMGEIGLQCAPSGLARSLGEAEQIAKDTGFPVILRPSFTLGGSGGGIAYNLEELRAMTARGLAESPDNSVLLERSLLGWKEFELEAVRDSADNCIIVCSIENLDPMGVHTGDSITVAPAQTLTDKEYQNMRCAAAAVLRRIGVDTGGANVQFAVNPQNGDMAVIEMNPRVSRSSALASKATGFPIAKVAAKLAIGYTLPEIQNDITGCTPASFEPSIDYVVVKIPRFDFAKFPPTPDRLTTQMRSVGEVMAVGATFAESLQKALRGLETGVCGLEPSPLPPGGASELREQLSEPSSVRLFAVARALSDDAGMTVEETQKLTNIDRWFLDGIKEITDAAAEIAQCDAGEICEARLRRWKQTGFSDNHIAKLLNSAGDAPQTGETIRRLREKFNLHPVYRRIDTCAGEFPSETAFLYSTYFYGRENPACELRPTGGKKIAVLGGGPNRIGQGIEFDYCCTHGVMALREAGYETIMINCNPETVSTDCDIAGRLFFEPLTAEDVWEICRREKPRGVIVQFGGQTPLSIARELERAGAPIIGTSVDAIDRAESRRRFQELIVQCGLRQPQNAIVDFKESDEKNAAQKTEEAAHAAAQFGYPLVVRPSYVLGGRAMEIVHDETALRAYFARPWLRGFRGEILLDKFLPDAAEVDADAVRDETGACIVAGIMQHIEEAGVHSGDSACCLPPHSLPAPLVAEIAAQTKTLAAALEVVGMLNIQFAVCGGEVYVLEANPRASRTAPFVSKAAGLPVAKIAARAMTGETFAAMNAAERPPPPYFSVKEAVFPFGKFPEVDVLLGPEMKSTGETMGIAADFPRAFMLAQEAIQPMPRAGAVFISVPDAEKSRAAEVAQEFHRLGFAVLATEGSARYFNENGVPAAAVNKVAQGRPHIVDAIVSGEVQIVINTETDSAQSRRDSFSIRRAALVNKVVYYTTVAGADAAARGLRHAREGASPCPLQEWQRKLKT